MKYHIAALSKNQTVDTHHYTSLGSSSFSDESRLNYPVNQSLQVDVTLTIEEYQNEEISSPEDFAEALRGLPAWCTDEMSQNALKSMYPEYYV